MLGQPARGAIIGIVVGAVALALAAATLDLIGQSIESLPSLGRRTDTRQLLGWVLRGALAGSVSGLIVGIILGILPGDLSGAWMGAITGALLLGLGGFVIGTFRPNGSSINYRNAIPAALIGAVTGAVIGLIIGSIINFLLKGQRLR